MATYNCTQICIPLLFSSRGALIEGVPFSMIVALCLGDLDALSNYDPLLFLHCCSMWWKIALIEHFTCLHVMFCLLRSSLSLPQERDSENQVWSQFCILLSLKVGLASIRFEIAALLNLLTKVMKGNWLCLPLDIYNSVIMVCVLKFIIVSISVVIMLNAKFYSIVFIHFLFCHVVYLTDFHS